MSEGTRARGRLMPAPFAMPCRGSCVAWLLVAPLVFRAPRWDGGSIPPISTTWCCWCSGCRRPRLWGRAALWGPAAVCAGGRRPAREIATRELRSEWSISRPALALPPPTGTAARPCRRPRAPQPCPPVPPAPSTPVEPGVMTCGSDCRLEARPGPATAHRQRSWAPPSRRTRIQRSLPTFLSPHPIPHAIPP